MDMDTARMLAIHEQITVRLKRGAVKAARGPQDINPSLFVTLSDGTHHVGKPIPSQMGEGFALPEALAVDVFLLWADKGKPVDRIIVCMDAYVRKIDFDDRDEVSDIRRGDLGKDFRNNPDSDVGEGCVTAFVWVDGDHIFGATCTQGYRLSEGGVLTWEEPVVVPPVDLLDPDVENYGAVMDAAVQIIQITREETE